MEHDTHPVLAGLRQMSRREMARIDDACDDACERGIAHLDQLLPGLEQSARELLLELTLEESDPANVRAAGHTEQLGRYLSVAVESAGAELAGKIQQELTHALLEEINRLHAYATTFDLLTNQGTELQLVGPSLVSRLMALWIRHRAILEGARDGALHEVARHSGALEVVIGIPAMQHALIRYDWSADAMPLQAQQKKAFVLAIVKETCTGIQLTRRKEIQAGLEQTCQLAFTTLKREIDLCVDHREGLVKDSFPLLKDSALLPEQPKAPEPSSAEPAPPAIVASATPMDEQQSPMALAADSIGGLFGRMKGSFNSGAKEVVTRAQPTAAQTLQPPDKPATPSPPPPPPVDAVPVEALAVVLTRGIRLELMKVHNGPFQMGCDSGVATGVQDNEGPARQVELPDYWIGRFPVTVTQFSTFVQSTGYKTQAERETAGWVAVPGTGLTRVPGADWQHPLGQGSSVANKAFHPVTLVSIEDARAFCRWASHLSDWAIGLPSEAQWEKAARGVDGRLWPWGTSPSDDRGAFAGKTGGTTSVGQFSPRGDSPYGCADMLGNVLEWTVSSPTAVPVIRGGSFREAVGAIRCTWRETLGDELPMLDNLGFRVIAVGSDEGGA